MRIILSLSSEGILKIPFSYNEIIQGLIYSHLDKVLADFLHNEGFLFKKRKFKLFTFSRILGRVKARRDGFEIASPFSIVISSPYNEILRSLAENLIRSSEVYFGKQNIFVESVKVEFSPKFEGPAHIKMLSPVTVYSTLKAPKGKKTYYYNPKEYEFSELIRENILKKYRAYYRDEPRDESFNIEPLKVSKRDEKIISYKGFIIKGWMGTYRLSGSSELLKLAYDAGIGAKNSQGFGCFEVINQVG